MTVLGVMVGAWDALLIAIVPFLTELIYTGVVVKFWVGLLLGVIVFWFKVNSYKGFILFFYSPTN